MFCFSGVIFLGSRAGGNGIKKPRRILIGVNYCLGCSDASQPSAWYVRHPEICRIEAKRCCGQVTITFSGPPQRLILRFLVVENGERCERAFHLQTGTRQKHLNSSIGWARMMEAIIDLIQLKGGCVCPKPHSTGDDLSKPMLEYLGTSKARELTCTKYKKVSRIQDTILIVIRTWVESCWSFTADEEVCHANQLRAPYAYSFQLFDHHRSSAAVSTNLYLHFEKRLAVAEMTDSDIVRFQVIGRTYNKAGQSLVAVLSNMWSPSVIAETYSYSIIYPR